ncbi:MAG: hypothetical protein ACTSR7_17865 [Promethearchaeota archaeon]
MEKTERKIWHETAGDTERDYVDICLRNQVILNGPGKFGSWPHCKANLIDFGKTINVSKSKKIEDLRRFPEEMKEGPRTKIFH